MMIPPPRWWARERSRRRSLCRRRRCLSFLLFFSSVVWSSKRLPFSCARSSSREIAVFVSLLKNDVSTTMCAKREASKSSSSSSSSSSFSRNSRVSFEGKTRGWSWCRRPKKVPLLFETFKADGVFLHRFFVENVYSNNTWCF